MVFHEDDCYSTYGSEDVDDKSVFPVDYSQCETTGCSMMRFYWLAFQGVDGETVWQVYSKSRAWCGWPMTIISNRDAVLAEDCIPLEGGVTTTASSASTTTTTAPETEAPTTAPATEAPATTTPATEAPATDTPATDAPATEAPATEAPTTDAPASEAETPAPSSKCTARDRKRV